MNKKQKQELAKELNVEIDKDLLEKALDNTKNANIMHLTNDKILQMNLDIIKELNLSREDTLAFMKKLVGYKFVDEINELKYGMFIKWIPLENPERLPLNNGGVICDIKITDDGTRIVCKTFNNRYYQFKMDECLIFQKLSEEEKIILNTLDYLD
jgi:transcriptional accessory protein Tex/SPT6